MNPGQFELSFGPSQVVYIRFWTIIQLIHSAFCQNILSMKPQIPFRTLIVLLILLKSSGIVLAEYYDVAVYGGTSGGIAAAIQVSRMGKTVVLIEPSQFLGGLTTGGLGATDIGNKRAIGGLSREFYQRIYQYYLNEDRWIRETREGYFKNRVKSPNEDSQWTFEPSAASHVYNEMIRGSKVSVVYGERLDLDRGVFKNGNSITRIVMESGKSFEAKVFIDASYEGDLMAKAGVGYHVGRESNQTYGETINGLQIRGAVHHQFSKEVDVYIKKGDPSSGLLPGVKPRPQGNDGDGDHRIQAYNFRLCTTDDPENRKPWPKPEGYDEQQFELLLRNFEAGDIRIPWHPIWMPNRKTDTNNNFAISTDCIGMNYEYPDGNYQLRAKIWREHELYTKGLLWTLANHPRVPESVRSEFNRLGLAKDEFVDNGNWPRQLYVREARRLISDYVMSEKNCKRVEVVPDSVGMGAYNMDSHNTQRYATVDGFARNEGDIQIPTRPYPISYRSIRPKASECSNLLIPVCLAASHIAYGSIRMEPVFMVMGQSAGTAAVLAIDQQTTVQKIDYERLKAQLLKDGQVLDFETAPLPAEGSVSKSKLEGIVIDDQEADRIGFTQIGQSIPPYVEIGYCHDGDSGKGMQSAKFIPNLPKAGNYRVSMIYSAANNRASNVPVVIHSADGDTKLIVDQRKKGPIDGMIYPLGTFRFESGKAGYVEISNSGTDGHVIVDAVQWIKLSD